MDLDGAPSATSASNVRARRWLSSLLLAGGLIVLTLTAGLAWYVNRLAPAPPATLGLADNPLPVAEGDSNVAAGASAGRPSSVADTRDAGNVAPAGSEAAAPPIRIVAPAIGLDAPVVPVGWRTLLLGGKQVNVWVVAEHAAGWHKGSASPGQVGNTVVSGHHNMAGEVFRYVVDLKLGDQVFLHTDERIFTYTVESRMVLSDRDEPETVRHENADWIGSFPDERLTLVTCWPYNDNSHRVIVVAKPVE